MNRRELLKAITALTGAAFIGGELFLSGCESRKEQVFSEEDIAFFDEVAETILPKTNTPGAREAGVGTFIALYASDCYDEKQQQLLKKGIEQLNGFSKKQFNTSFIPLPSKKKEALLTAIDKEAKDTKASDSPHYFTMLKQLTLLGFFTSRPGATQVLRYLPVPGGYEGCMDYNGETAWA